MVDWFSRKNWIILLCIFICIFQKSSGFNTDSLNLLFNSPELCKATIDQIEGLSINLCDSNFALLQNELADQTNKIETNKDKTTLIKYYYFLGYHAYENEDDVEALKFFLTSLEFIKGSEYPYLQFKINYRIANSYARIKFYTNSYSLFEKAISYYKKAEQILNAIPDNDDEKVSLYTLIAHCYHGCDKADESLMYYKKAATLAKSINKDETIVKTQLNLGNFYYKYQEIEKGEKTTLLALHYADSINYCLGKIYCLVNLCQINALKRDFKKALEYADETFAEADKCNNNHMKFRAIQEKGRIYKKLGDTARAVKLLEESILYLDPVKDQHHLKNTLKELSAILFHHKQYVKSSFFQQRYIHLADSINKSDFEKKTNMAEALYLHESLTFKNKLLDKENRLREFELNKTKTVATAAIIIGALFAFIVFYQIRANSRYREQNEQIISQNKTINEKNQEIERQNKYLNNNKNKLELLVEERTRELKQALLDSKSSNEFKSEFLKNVSHEIRTPLNAIVGFSNLLENNKIFEEKQIRQIKIIKQNSFELVNTVEKIIEVADIEKSCQLKNAERISLEKLNEEIELELTRYAKLIKVSKVNFELQTPMNGEEIFIDNHKCKRILIHLLDNALKFSDDIINISSERSENTINFIVEDYGIGIKDDNLELILKAFNKVQNNKHLFRGMGIGLTIANRLTLAMNGQLSIKSELNKGTKVTVNIPC